MTEEQFLQRVQQDPARFGEVYDRYYAAIFNYCLRRTGHFADARDICSEAFLKAYLNIGRFQWRGISIRSWLYRIATNEIKLFYRSRKYRPALLSEVNEIGNSYRPTTSLAEEQAAAELELARHQQFLAVRAALQELPLKYQEVISLKYFERLKIRELDRRYGDRSLLNWVIRFLLLCGPVVAMGVNLVSVTHVRYERVPRELVLSFKLKWLNWGIIVLCAGLFAVFFLYLVVENVGG